MNTNINFWDLPNISEKLNASEITEMNKVFNDPQVQQRLEEIEIQRKIRRKWKFGIYGGVTLIVVVLSLLIGQGSFFAGLFFTIGSGDNTFSPVFTAAFWSYALAIGFLYSKFSKLIEIPLKMEVLAKLCPVIYSKLAYSHDAKYSFDELDVLLTSWIIKSYDTIDLVEDSMEFEVERDGKKFFVNGFELQTSEIRWSGRDRKRVVTNHDYLIKAVFPSARIPLKSDLKIISDQADQWITSKFWSSIVIGIVLWFVSLFITLILELPWSICFMIAIAIGWGAGYAMHLYNNKKMNTNRVELENIEFEKLFDVKCEDQVTSRMILTPAFMDRIVSFVHKTGNQYEFLFQGNTLYIKRKIPGKYLEVGTEKNILTNLSWFVQFYCDMREVMLFINDMNLMYLSKTDSSLVNISQEYHRSEALRFEKVSPLWFFAKFQPLLRFFPNR